MPTPNVRQDVRVRPDATSPIHRHVWSTEMNLLAEQLGRAQHADLLAAADEQRLVARVLRARRADRRAARAAARAARAHRHAAEARLVLG